MHTTTISRRHLLGGAALAGAAGTLAHRPVLRQPLDLAALDIGRIGLRIGVVHTSGTRWDAFDGGVVGGLQRAIAALPWLHADLDIRPAPSGVTGVRDQLQAAAQDNDVLVAAVSRPMGHRIDDLLAALQVPTLIAATGATSASAPSAPGVAVHTLHLTEAAATAGAIAVDEHGPRIGVIGTRSEMLFSTWGAADTSIRRAGGQVVHTEMIDPADGPTATSAAVRRMRAAGVDAILLETSADADAGLLGMVQQGRLAGVPVLASPLAIDPALRRAGGHTGPALMRSCTPWAAGVSGTGAVAEAPDLGTLLGIESGLLIADAAARSGGSTRRLGGELTQAVAAGPRGTIRMGTDAVSEAPLWLTSATAGQNRVRTVRPVATPWTGTSAVLEELLCI